MNTSRRLVTAALLGLALGSLTACGGGEDPKPNPLGYDINLRGTLNGWGTTAMDWDAIKGVLYVKNVPAGPTSAGDPRRFKFATADWSRQLSAGPNTAGYSSAEATVQVVGNTGTKTLTAFGDGKDMPLPLASDDANPSGSGVLLDFEITITDAGTPATGVMTVKVH